MTDQEIAALMERSETLSRSGDISAAEMRAVGPDDVNGAFLVTEFYDHTHVDH